MDWPKWKTLPLELPEEMTSFATQMPMESLFRALRFLVATGQENGTRSVRQSIIGLEDFPSAVGPVGYLGPPLAKLVSGSVNHRRHYFQIAANR
jgi:hypothetical protein